MNTPICEHRPAVLLALARQSPMGTVLTDHVRDCADCGAVVGALREPLDRALAAPFADAGRVPPASVVGLDENEAALLLSGFGEPTAEVHALSADDRRRLYRVARALDDHPEAGEPSVERRLQALGVRPTGPVGVPATADPVPQVPAPSAPRWTLIVAAAAAVLIAVGLGGIIDDRRIADRSGSTDAIERLVVRGTMVGLTLGLGDSRCIGVRDPVGWAFVLGSATPCRWRVSDETFTMNVRVEPYADTRYLAIFARDSSGDITLLYPDNGMPVGPLETTRGLISSRCADDLCWLEGGRYDVAPGKLSVVAVFSTEPLPTADMVSQWAPMHWTGHDRLVERFELEVIP